METSTTATDNPTNDDATSTTVTDPEATDTQTATTGNDLDNPSDSDTTTTGTDDDTTSTTDDGNGTEAPALDTDLKEWIEKRGLKVPEDEAELQSFQKMRDEQREFTRERQAKKESEQLNKTIKDSTPEVTDDDDDDDMDPLEKRVAAQEQAAAQEKTARLQSEFWIENKVTSEEGTLISAILKEKIDARESNEEKLQVLKTWGDPKALPDLLELAKARIANSVDPNAVKEQAAQEERDRIERESHSKSPGRSASSTSTSDKTEDEARLERFKARYNK